MPGALFCSVVRFGAATFRFFGSGERRTVLCATVNAVSGLPDAVHAADRES
jgi:hypothetical protein